MDKIVNDTRSKRSSIFEAQNSYVANYNKEIFTIGQRAIAILTRLIIYSHVTQNEQVYKNALE